MGGGERGFGFPPVSGMNDEDSTLFHSLVVLTGGGFQCPGLWKRPLVFPSIHTYIRPVFTFMVYPFFEGYLYSSLLCSSLRIF